MSRLPTPRTQRAIVRKPDKDGAYVPAATCEQIEQELAGLLARHATAGTLAPGDVFDIVFRQKGVESGFFHQVWAYDQIQVAKDGGYEKPLALKKRLEFRVGIYGKGAGNYVESTKPNLLAAVHECLKRLKLPIPEELK